MRIHKPSQKAAANQSSSVSAYRDLSVPRPFAKPLTPEEVPLSTTSGGAGFSLARMLGVQRDYPPIPDPTTSGAAGFSFARMCRVQQEQQPMLQPKLEIGEPGDQYEQEADRVAAEVVQRIQAADTPPVSPPASGDGDEKPIQRSPAIAATVPTLQADFETQLNRARSGGSPLDNAFRAKVEPAMGADFSGVKVHTGAAADQLARSIQAKAFTTGQDVFFRQGAYEPGSRGGQELLAHELTHVVQQVGGETLQKIAGGIKKERISRMKESGKISTNMYVGNGKKVVKTGDSDSAKKEGTVETGYTKFKFEEGECAKDWKFNEGIVKIDADGKGVTIEREVALPITCIESAEHIIRNREESNQVRYEAWKDSQARVILEVTRDKKLVPIDTQAEDIADSLNPGDQGIDFEKEPVKVNQGLLAITPPEKKSKKATEASRVTMHVVVVIGRSLDHSQILVVERNAGKLADGSLLLDKNWLCNLYNSEEGFREGGGEKAIIGRLRLETPKKSKRTKKQDISEFDSKQRKKKKLSSEEN